VSFLCSGIGTFSDGAQSGPQKKKWNVIYEIRGKIQEDLFDGKKL
jgi:hypothetical protein